MTTPDWHTMMPERQFLTELWALGMVNEAYITGRIVELRMQEPAFPESELPDGTRYTIPRMVYIRVAAADDEASLSA